LKLPKPFFRLPVRFDAARLRAEAEALSAGAVQPPALLAAPYLRQVLASFGTVWSRIRLVRYEGGTAAPPHSDASHHAFYRVPLHIPVVTRPDVRFHCAGQDVHMAAGEAWVHDDWRRHQLENPGAEAALHLVAETAGTSRFWQFVREGQADGFDRPAAEARPVAFDPSVEATLEFERFDAAPVMPPAELEQLTADLLADLTPADKRPDSVSAAESFKTAVLDFRRDWRTAWYQHGDLPEGRHEFARLVDGLRRRLRELPPVRVASTGAVALTVLEARVLSVSHERAGEEPTVSSLPTVELPQIELPTVEVRRLQTVEVPQLEPEPHLPPVLDRPIVILSAPRAGSTLLFETLAQAAGIFTIGGESHQLIESIAALRPGRGMVSSNRLTRKDATRAIVAELRQRFAGRIHDRDQQPPASGARVRLLEKTPKNALRVPFLLEVFPDAQFIFLHREPRANLSSMMQAWRGKGWVTYRGLPGWPGPWSLLLPPGYERLQGRPLEEVVAYQWRIANETILDDLADLPRERWTAVRYEAFLADPRAEVGRLLDFAGLAMDDRLAEYLAKPLPLSKYTQTRPEPDKWKQNEKEIARVMPQLAAVVGRLDG
jgi:hypothetical protein